MPILLHVNHFLYWSRWLFYWLGVLVSFHFNSDFGNLLSGGLNSSQTTQLVQHISTLVLEICYLVDSTHLNYSTRSTNLDSGFGNLLHILATLSWIITGNFYMFLVNLVQDLKVSYRFWKIKIFWFIDSAI